MDIGFDPFLLMKYFWVLAYAAVIAIAYAVGKLAMRKRLNKLRELAPHLGGNAISGFLGPRLEGVKSGRSFMVSIVSGGKNSPPVLKLSIDTFLPAQFSISRPDIFSGLLAGFMKKAETGDKVFDSEFFCTSPEPVTFASLFSDARRRDAAKRLFSRGYQRIDSRKGKIAANMPAKDIDSELDAGKIASALDDLAELSA